VEELVGMFGDVYKNRDVLVRGHTGFKGSWLVLWVEMPGTKVTGVSLPPIEWEISDQQQPHEAKRLQPDSDRACRELACKPVWTFREWVEAMATWYRAWLDRSDVTSRNQLKNYVQLARDRGHLWAKEVP
jgi:nucleoside-diphosphate-sugar epimerase